MPRLFTRKKKKKPSIKDALATLPVFIAVPQAPQPEIVASGGQAVRISSPLHPQLVSNPSDNTEVIVTSTGVATSPLDVRTDSAVPSTPRPISTGTQSEWPPNESGELMDESDTEFGYATVRETDPVRTLAHNPTKSSHPLPDLPQASPTGHLKNPSGRDTPPTGGDDDSDIDSPALSPDASIPLQSGDPSMTPPPGGSGHDHVRHHREPIPTTAGPETLYAKVNKPPQSRHKKGKKHSPMGTHPSPKTPNSAVTSPPYREQVHVESDHMSGQRESPITSQRAESPHAAHKSRHGQSPVTTRHTGSPNASQQRQSPIPTPHVNQDGQPHYYSKLRQEGTPGQTTPVQHRRQEVTVSQGRPDGRGSGFEMPEYSDEDYIPSGDDTFTITETSFSDDQLILQHLATTVSPRGYKDKTNSHHQKLTSSAPVPHRPPVVSPPPPPRPSTPMPGQSRAKSTTPVMSHRPASAPEANSISDSIPFIHPTFIQQVSPSRPQSQPYGDMGEVYIFSEKLPDGSEQFYAASPVQSLSKAEQNSIQSPLTPPLTQQQTSSPPRRVGFRHSQESHYYSQPSGDLNGTLLIANQGISPTQVPTQQSHDAQSQAHRGTIKGTKITKLGSPVGGQHSSPIVPQTTPNVNLVTSPRDLKKSGLDELDVGLPSGSPGARVGVGEEGDSEYLKLRRSLTMEKAALSKQLANEQRQLKMKESQVTQLRDRVTELQDENEKLTDDKQCLELERVTVDHCSLSLKGENSALSRQLGMIKENMREMKITHQTKISALSDEMLVLRSEREAIQDKLTALTANHTHLRHQFQKLTTSLPARVSISDHKEALAGIQGLLDDLSERNESKLRSQETRLRFKDRENKSLVLKLTDAAAVIVKLEEENKQLQRTNRRAQEKVSKLQLELECSRDREVAVHQQLSEAIRKAESTKAEKETLAKIAKVQRRSVEKAAASEVENSLTISHLERKLEACEEALMELNRASAVKKKDHGHHRKQYEEEIQHLRTMLTRKQKQMELLAQEKRTAENQLDLLWRASSSEGRSPTLDLLKTSHHRQHFHNH